MEIKFWKKLFLICFGLFAGTAFCMKWMEKDFVYNGTIFTIIGLEASYTKEKMVEILSGIDGHVKEILKYHLYFDFAFMAAVYPGIASLCIMARTKTASSVLKKVLLLSAFLQVVAWGCDIIENIFLLKWVGIPQIGNEFVMFHLVVFTKWILALVAVIVAIYTYLKNKISNKSHFLI